MVILIMENVLMKWFNHEAGHVRSDLNCTDYNFNENEIFCEMKGELIFGSLFPYFYCILKMQ